MLSGTELLRLVRHARIDDIEGHIAAVYAMEASEFAGIGQATLAGVLAAAGLVGTFLSAAGPITDQGARALGLIVVAGAFGYTVAWWRQAWNRRDLPAAIRLARLLSLRAFHE